MFRLVFCLLLFIPDWVYTQDITYARALLDTLCSAEMAGRGGGFSGEKKAARFIADEYARIGLKPLGKDYLQHFSYPLTVFDGNMLLLADKDTLQAGKDFLVDPSSGPLNGTFSLVWYNASNIPDKKKMRKLLRKDFFKNKVIVLDMQHADEKKEAYSFMLQNPGRAHGIIMLTHKKLTWGKSTEQKTYALLEVKAGSLPRETRQIEVAIDSRHLLSFQSYNVCGYIPGRLQADSFLVFTAHYDHLGIMGREVFFPGANDNASGVAMLLNLATHYAQSPHAYSTVFLAFGGEEAGLIGSGAFVQQPLLPLKRISFLINFDITGTGDEGVTVVNATEHEKEFALLSEINTQQQYLKQVKKRGPAANSDHYFFAKNGVPCFYIYTMGGISAYHDIYDVPETLPLDAFENYFRLVRDFCHTLSGGR